jgi:hypothetical protein
MRFRTTIDSPPPADLEFYLDVDLLFSDLSNTVGPTRILGLSPAEGHETSPLDLHLLGKQVFKLSGLSVPLALPLYVPVTFEESRYIRTRVNVHSAFVGLLLPSLSSADDKDQKKDKSNEKDAHISTDGAIDSFDNLLAVRPQEASARLFADSFRTSPQVLPAEDIERFFLTHIITLVKTHEQIRERLQEIGAKFLSLASRTMFGSQIVKTHALLLK